MRFLLIILLLMPVSITANNVGYVANHLSQAQFTTRVNNRVPVDDITKLSTNYKKIYFFTDVRDCSKCEIEHQWWYRGIKIGTIEGKTTGGRYRWWTSKNLNVDFIGDITVKVIVAGDEVYTKTFTYYNPTHTQQQTIPIQQRVNAQESDDCELQLRYFSDKVSDSPDDPYFKFMLKKWGKRCSGE